MGTDVDPTISEVCRRNSISELLSSRGVNMVKAGKRIKCKCPLPDHKTDNTPSFNIGQFDDGTEYFKCFGCGLSGNVISLLALLDNVTKGVVVRRLANIAGIKLNKIHNIVKIDPTNDDILQAMCDEDLRLKSICLKIERFIAKSRGDADMVTRCMRIYMRAKKLVSMGDEDGLLKIKASMDDLEARGYTSGVVLDEEIQ